MGSIVWFLVIVASLSCEASSSRISAQHHDLSKASKVFIGPGLITVLDFPDQIVDVKIGSPDRIKTVISPQEPRELTLFLTSSSQFQTNMIVRSQNKVYVFDIVPSLRAHQDYIKIQTSNGSPQNSSLIEAHSVTIAPRERLKSDSKKATLLKGSIE